MTKLPTQYSKYLNSSKVTVIQTLDQEMYDLCQLFNTSHQFHPHGYLSDGKGLIVTNFHVCLVDICLC